ncbi:MAG TPA: hypothetical protein VE153_07760 [Myxococcus sp.]|nr:hypothetical protein [Myxococcus sp.]
MKKPEPERTEPIRNWQTLFGVPDPARRPDAVPPPPSPDPIARGVDMGYRVIEDYLRRGQEAARAMGMPPFSGAQPGPGTQNPMEGLFRTFSDFMTQWMNVMGVRAPRAAHPGPMGTAGPFVVGGQDAAPMPPPVPPPPAPAPATARPVRVAFDVQSHRPVELALDWHSRSAGTRLVVHELRTPQAEGPRIGGVTAEWRPGEDLVVVRVRIPDAQAPGLYSGLILDEATGLPCGTVTARLSA